MTKSEGHAWRPRPKALKLAPANWRKTLEKPETQQTLKGLRLLRYDLDHARSGTTADAH